MSNEKVRICFVLGVQLGRVQYSESIIGKTTSEANAVPIYYVYRFLYSIYHQQTMLILCFGAKSMMISDKACFLATQMVSIFQHIYCLGSLASIKCARIKSRQKISTKIHCFLSSITELVSFIFSNTVKI